MAAVETELKLRWWKIFLEFLTGRQWHEENATEVRGTLKPQVSRNRVGPQLWIDFEYCLFDFGWSHRYLSIAGLRVYNYIIIIFRLQH